MILECPSCKTRYTIPDDAIGINGRAVRCAKCGHSWHQWPQGQEPPVAAKEPEAEVPAPMPEPEPAAPADDHDYGGYDESIPSRGNPAKRWTIIAAVIGVLLIAGAVALQFVDLDKLRTQLGMGRGSGSSVSLLLEVPRKPERRTLASGNELFALTGRVVNPTRERQSVPDIQAELQDSEGRVVYNWVITPPMRTLAPGAAAEFNAAEVDVPKGARELKLSFVGTRS
jgi:predicted Zn finger-like uncharacterized protein